MDIGYVGEGSEYFQICTPYATKHILTQLQRTDSSKYVLSNGSDTVSVANKKHMRSTQCQQMQGLSIHGQ